MPPWYPVAWAQGTEVEGGGATSTSQIRLRDGTSSLANGRIADARDPRPERRTSGPRPYGRSAF